MHFFARLRLRRPATISPIWPMTANTQLLEQGGAQAPDLAAALRPRMPVELCKRGEVRVERILKAATEVFIDKGYQQARLSEIVARAGGSLATLYRVFGDKEGLAHAIIQRRLEDLSKRLRDLHLTGLPADQALRQAAERIAEYMTTPESVVVHRIVIGEGQSFPTLRDWFFDHAVASLRDSLSDYFRQESDAGRLRIADPDMAASQFFMMLLGDLVLRVSCGNLHDPDPAQLRVYAAGATDLFLHGALPR